MIKQFFKFFEEMILKNRDTKKQIKMRNRVFKHMLKTRGWKYRAFLRYLRFFKYAAFAPTRGEFLESYYVLMRFLDDVVDGDKRELVLNKMLLLLII